MKWLASRNGQFHIFVNNSFLNTNLGGFVVTKSNKSLLAILLVERWLTRTNLSCINLIVYLKFSAQQNMLSKFLDKVWIQELQRRYSKTVDDKIITSNKNKVNFTNWAKIKSKNYTCLTKWPCLRHEMAKISSWEMTRF